MSDPPDVAFDLNIKPSPKPINTPPKIDDRSASLATRDDLPRNMSANQ